MLNFDSKHLTLWYKWYSLKNRAQRLITDKPGGPFEPGFMVRPLAWTTSTSSPPFRSISPISTSPDWVKK